MNSQWWTPHKIRTVNFYFFFNSHQEKKRLSLGDRMDSKQRESSVFCKSNKSSESKTSCYANSITAHGFPALHSGLTLLKSKKARVSKLYIIFPSSQPLSWIFIIAVFRASVSKRATLETHHCHFSITHQALFQRCSQSQTPAKIRVLPLSRALCPALGRINQGSGNWVLPHVSTVMSSLSSDGEGYGLSRFPKDTYYRLMVLLYRSKGTFRLLLISSEAPDEMARLS